MTLVLLQTQARCKKTADSHQPTSNHNNQIWIKISPEYEGKISDSRRFDKFSALFLHENVKIVCTYEKIREVVEMQEFFHFNFNQEIFTNWLNWNMRQLMKLRMFTSVLLPRLPYSAEIRGTSILGEVCNVWISRATQQLLCSKSHDFLAIFALAHSKINQIA